MDFQLDCWLTPQQYTLTVATQDADGSSHDWLDDTIAFDVVDTRVAAGRGESEGQGGMARLTVKVHPRAKRSALAGRLGDAWKLSLAAPPVDGKANDECVRFFAEFAGVPRSRVRIVTGLTSRLKVVEIEGVPQEDLERLLTAYRSHT